MTFDKTLVCLAHERGQRVIPWVSFTPEILMNNTLANQWLAAQMLSLEENYYDG